MFSASRKARPEIEAEARHPPHEAGCPTDRPATDRPESAAPPRSGKEKEPTLKQDRPSQLQRRPDRLARKLTSGRGHSRGRNRPRPSRPPSRLAAHNRHRLTPDLLPPCVTRPERQSRDPISQTRPRFRQVGSDEFRQLGHHVESRETAPFRPRKGLDGIAISTLANNQTAVPIFGNNRKIFIIPFIQMRTGNHDNNPQNAAFPRPVST